MGHCLIAHTSTFLPSDLLHIPFPCSGQGRSRNSVGKNLSETNVTRSQRSSWGINQGQQGDETSLQKVGTCMWRPQLRAHLYARVGRRLSQVSAEFPGTWLLWAGRRAQPCSSCSCTGVHPATQNRNAQAFCSATWLVFSFAFLPSIILHFRPSHPPRQGLWHWQFFSWAPLSTSPISVLRSPSSNIMVCGRSWRRHAQHAGKCAVTTGGEVQASCSVWHLAVL